MREFTRQLGQLFIIGYPGPTPPAPWLAFVREERLGGTILFADNCPDYDTVRSAIDQFRTAAGTETPFVAIDQEGGRVSRITTYPARINAAADYGREGNVEHFREDYRRSVGYLATLGFTVNLAPVADIELRSDNSCLDGRCFGTDPEMVAMFVRTAVETARGSGMLSCLKHFPGLGAATIDPHRATPEVDLDLLVWEQRERVPFAAGVAAGAELVMTTHLSTPALDKTIATGSSYIVNDLIRKHLGFEGPVITDDLSMDGAAPLGTLGERAIAAFNAGHDLLLFGQDYEPAMAAYDAFVDAVDRGEISAERVRRALQRVQGLRFRLQRQFVR